MDPNQQPTTDPNQPITSQDPINPYTPTAPSAETVTANSPETPTPVTETQIIPAPQDDLMIQEEVQEVSPTPPIQELPTPPEPTTENPLQTLTQPETPAQTVNPAPSPSIQEPMTVETPPAPTLDLKAELKPESPNVIRILLIGVVLILLGVLIGVIASNLIPQVQTPAPIVPTPTEEVTPMVTPEEASPSPTLEAKDQMVIDKFAGKKTTGGIIPDLIQKCTYKGSSIYTLSQTSSTDSPSIIVDRDGKYIMTCGLEDVKKTANCDLVSMCQEIWKQEESKKVSYKCPAGEWVDCMPIVEESRKFECEKPYLDWAKANCPGFKGTAL